jgi:S1-C subfamily serine protease
MQGRRRGMKKEDWEIPPNLQPDPDDYSFDLERALNAVVSLKTYIPQDAYTANTLGTERAGSGVVIRDSGLIATIGYLITEAETIWVTSNNGRAVAGHALAYDQETGFGLVQALGRLDLPVLELGDSDRLKVGDQVVFSAGGGRHHSIETRIVGRQEFAGYWEYLLDEALFTAPAHPFWGGGALIGSDGKLMGIGSLILQQGDRRGRRLDMNMVVPISLLGPIMQDLMTVGRVNRPARPWLGMLATESDDTLVVGGLADNGPAEQAGVRQGDRILAVNEEDVPDLAGLWRRVWASGSAGAEVRLRLQREGGTVAVTVRSGDRARFLKTPQLH